MHVEARRAVVLVTLVLLVGTVSAEDCSVVKCMLNLFKCNRSNVAKGVEGGCCPQYFACVLACEPDAKPTCDEKGKRGSWNKREHTFNPYNSLFENY